MAWRMKLQFPAFKVTERCTSGHVARSIVPRGRTNPSVREEGNISGGQSIHTDDDSTRDDGSDDVPQLDSLWEFSEDSSKTIAEPSLHEIKQKASVQAWSNIRPTLLKVVVECCAMRCGQRCLLCDSEATYRCVQCAPWAHYCTTCFGKAHLKANIFHVGEIWEVSQSFSIVLRKLTLVFLCF